MTDVEPVFIDEGEIRRLGLTPSDARNALLHAYRLQHAGRVHVQPKMSLDIAPGRKFQAMCAACEELGLAVVKWLGVAPRIAGDASPGIHALAVLNDFNSGVPLAVMEANAMTGLRTAGMSALAAWFLARKDSRTIGFIGCGLQARMHLEAMCDLFPSLTVALCNSRSEQSARRLADSAETLGLEGRVYPDPAQLLRESDIVVTSVPASADFEPFLDASHLAPGAFVAAVDIGRSWHSEGFAAVDCVATDSRLHHGIDMKPGIGIDCDLSELAGGVHAGRESEAQRALFVFQGHATADLAIAWLVRSRL
ncbi:Gfo/Idh/MocA family oxidoreductase [uncultured Nitratireductor sp.]|uniref:ornithine cyclodeaminase family protein n=1 Tax=uncultured Nitratireductor sp. TaxID=520953 RepID=UPI0025E761C1|nr:Gfo/Idh/MocA family oxidoreductase [uncultured Nitratireductor sp.]